ncbi:BANK1 protein, partial [Scytalopus superciliaris]|nr:BANK1 protein [Scytalopus superciliaris]
KEDSEEEHLYSAVKLEESVYDFILVEEERRKHCRSFIMNRPPAPAPHPKCSLVREENVPYIAQVFQQKATQVTSDNNRTYCTAKKPGYRSHTDTVTYSTVKYSNPAEQVDVIHLQEQVKKGTISVDEALDRFKQWQKEKEITVHSAVHQLRDTTIGNRQENEN